MDITGDIVRSISDDKVIINENSNKVLDKNEHY